MVFVGLQGWEKPLPDPPPPPPARPYHARGQDIQNVI
jgi:hypothetical protein